MIQAKHVMVREVISVTPETPVDEIARLFVEHGISGVPVIDAERRVVGMVTDSELFLKEKGIPFSAVKLPSLFRQWVDPAHLADIYAQAKHHTAADVMSENPVCVNMDDDIGQVAWVMAQNDVNHVPVVRQGVLAGFISRIDLIRYLAQRRRQ